LKSYNRFVPQLAAGVLLLKVGALLFPGDSILPVFMELPDAQLQLILLH
jgi:hypothetical protein